MAELLGWGASRAYTEKHARAASVTPLQIDLFRPIDEKFPSSGRNSFICICAKYGRTVVPLIVGQTTTIPWSFLRALLC